MSHHLNFIIAAFLKAMQLARISRAQLAVSFISTITSLAAGVVTLWILFDHRLATRASGYETETVIAYGFYLVFDGLVGAFFAPSLSKIGDQIISGEFDALLLQPVGLRQNLIFGQISPWRAFDIVAGILVVTGFSWKQFDYRTLPVVAFAVLLAALLCFSIWQLLVAISIRYIRITNSAQLFAILVSLGRFPLALYPTAARFVLTYILPVALISSVPAAIIQDSRTASYSLSVLFVIVAVIYIASEYSFRNVLKRYVGI